MRCHDARASIPLLIDNLLDDEEAFAVRQHLNACAECQAFARAHERDEQAINQYLRGAPYAPVARDVIGEIERRRRPWWDAFRTGSNRLAGVVGLVLVVLVVGAGAWALREVATSDPSDTDPGQDMVVSSPDVSSDDQLLIGEADIGYILSKLENAGLVFDTGVRSETDAYTIEYGRIAFDRHFTLVEYRAEAVDENLNLLVNVRGVPGGGGGQPARFTNGVSEGWMVLAAMYPGASQVFIEDYDLQRDNPGGSHEVSVDLSALPYYNEGILRYETADIDAGVELCCLVVERGVAVSTVRWDWEILDPDELVRIDQAEASRPNATVDGEPLRLLDARFYRPIPLDGNAVAVYGLPSEGEFELVFSQVTLSSDDPVASEGVVEGEWLLSAQLDQPAPQVEPTPEPTIPADVAQDPTPTPAPEVEITPIPSDDDEAEDRLRVLVYLVRGEEIGVSAREIPYTQQVATASIQALLDGPNYTDQDAGLHSEIPQGTELLGISLDYGTLTVDLSAEFGTGGGSASMLMRLAQVVHTATQFDSVRNVQILIEGERVDALGGEGVLINAPLDRDDFEDQAPAILIETPGPGETVGSTVRLIGTANTFEATLQIEIIGPGGDELYSGHDMASSGTGERGVFDLTIPIELESDGWGTIRMFEYSARDGSRVNVVTIPVRFERED